MIAASQQLQRQQEKQKLSEQLTLLKEDNKALYEEGVRLLKQKELCVRYCLGSRMCGHVPKATCQCALGARRGRGAS